jgi:hypothetical protein
MSSPNVFEVQPTKPITNLKSMVCITKINPLDVAF